jgi:hypothetical protein
VGQGARSTALRIDRPGRHGAGRRDHDGDGIWSTVVIAIDLLVIDAPSADGRELEAF